MSIAQLPNSVFEDAPLSCVFHSAQDNLYDVGKIVGLSMHHCHVESQAEVTPGMTLSLFVVLQFALVVRIYRSREPLVIPDSPHFAGCRSWVELPESLSTGGLEPALDAEAFGRMRSASLDALGSS